MKKIIFLVTTLITVAVAAQHSISGTFTPAEEYQWLIAYKMEPGGQNYVADTKITDGKFSLKLPENSSLGTYRLVYAVPQEEFYFDVIYNGKEDISLEFSLENGVVFNTSEENKLFNNYFNALQESEQEIISFYSSGNEDVAQFRNLVQRLSETQSTYENKSEGLLVHQFIVANRPYIPASYETVEQYISNKKKNYFKELNLADEFLQASGYLTDKIINYVFTALPLHLMDQQETEQAINENITQLNSHLDGVNLKYKLRLLDTLWSIASDNGLNYTADHIYNKYLKDVAIAQGNQEIIKKIDTYNKLRIGAVAPDVVWKDGQELKKLSGLAEKENYVLVFWSSTCSHCLDELPKLHAGIKNNTTTKVLAIGLEDDELNWKKESAKLADFEHAISLGKWESEYAHLYNIQQTPTYFILDSEKRIVAKPSDYKDALNFLKRIQ